MNQLTTACEYKSDKSILIGKTWLKLSMHIARKIPTIELICPVSLYISVYMSTGIFSNNITPNFKLK